MFLRNFPARLEEVARERNVAKDDIEIWFADEARIGQKNKITRRWAKRGSRPSAPKDQRTPSAYIFGAICPKDGKGAALVMPRCSSTRPAGIAPAASKSRQTSRWSRCPQNAPN